MSDNNIVYQGPGLCTLVFITFLVLKLCEVITWSWWWVTAPLWIPLGLVLSILPIILVLVLIIAIIVYLVDKIGN